MINTSIETGYYFRPRSLEQLATCHEDLQRIAKFTLSKCRIDFAITEGHRSVERQQELYSHGRNGDVRPKKTNVDGVKVKSKHNYDPSLAFDFVACVKEKEAYNTNDLVYLGACFECCAVELYTRGVVKHIIRWGGNWNRDGKIIKGQRLIDLPHVELIKPS